ncbi:Insulinase (Peptidase family M16) family protein [Raphanus sativus]|nr:Insulinase (Peptidase family M16) family protein [Raphanus sativus]
MEHTKFYFQVQAEFLEGALDRFSQFFSAPLLEADCMKREISAVDSEFQLRKEDDYLRLEELRAYTSKKGHLFNRFTCGNKESLNKEDLRERAIELYNECYTGGAMKLCVIGADSLSVLERWVRTFFGDVKKGHPKNIPSFNPRDRVWDTSVSYGMKVAGDGHILELSWILPPLSKNTYLERPEQYLVQLLAQRQLLVLNVFLSEGKGSLSYFFKDNGWTNFLQVKESFEGWFCTSIGRMIIISMDLTLSGLEKRYQLIRYVYEYLKLIQDKKPQRWVMEEYWKIKQMDYDSLEMDLNQLEFAKLLSGNMLHYPLTHVISADYSSNWNSEAILELLEYFTPERMRIDFASKSVDGKDLKTEPWCNSVYLEEQIPLDCIEAWRKTSRVDASLFFPSENKFIPTAFKVREHEEEDLHPRCILQTPKIRLWHQCEESSSTYAYFRVYLKDGYSSLENHAMAGLFTELLNDELNEILDQSDEAKLCSSISLRGDQLFLEVFGYREKLNLLLSEIWTRVMGFSPTAKRFEIIKEKTMKDLKKMSLEEGSDRMMLQILCKKFYGINKKLQVLKEISFPDLEIFISHMRSQIFIEGLCYGDVLETEALEISEIFKTPQQVKPLPNKLRHKMRMRRLPRRAKLINVKVSDSNNLLKIYFQIGKKMRMKAMVDLFNGIIKEMIFSQLRNKEQLGYIVDCSPHLMGGVNGFSIYVISANRDPIYLFKQVRRFVYTIKDRLEDVPDGTFQDYKRGVILSLEDGIDAQWKDIVSKRYTFDSYSRETAEIETIQKEDLIKWYSKYFRVSSPSCRRLALCLWGCDTDMKRNSQRCASRKIFRLKRRLKRLTKRKSTT